MDKPMQLAMQSSGADMVISSSLRPRLFWPGPLLLLLKPTAQGRLLTFPEYPTVAIRVPAPPAARAMIEASGVPWIYTSANKSGKPAKLNAADVRAELGADIDLLIDGGAVPDGDPTLVDATATSPATRWIDPAGRPGACPRSSFERRTATPAARRWLNIFSLSFPAKPVS
jgi:L-threonylcarbamoyladenylate synthase